MHKHNELAIAGIGKFTSDDQGFMVNPVSKIISPRQKNIRFQAHSDETSAPFVSFFEELHGLDTSSVVDKLSQLAIDFEIFFKSNSKLMIEPFGFFKLDQENQIQWESSKSECFEESSFGLFPVHFAANLTKVKRIIVEKHQHQEEEEDLTYLRESALKELKVLLDNAQISESVKPKKANRVFPIVASVLTLALLINLALFLFKSPDKQSGKQPENQVSQMDMLGNAGEMIDSQSLNGIVAEKKVPVDIKALEKEISQMISLDSVDKHIGLFISKGDQMFDSSLYTAPPAEAILAEPIIISPAPLIEPIPSAIKSVEPELENTATLINTNAAENQVESGFYLIAGAFKGLKNAEKLRQELITKGYKQASVVKPTKYKYKLVFYEKYNTLEEATRAQEKVQDENWEVWVYHAY